jgi:hypothetical protein
MDYDEILEIYDLIKTIIIKTDLGSIDKDDYAGGITLDIGEHSLYAEDYYQRIGDENGAWIEDDETLEKIKKRLTEMLKEFQDKKQYMNFSEAQKVFTEDTTIKQILEEWSENEDD